MRVRSFGRAGSAPVVVFGVAVPLALGALTFLACSGDSKDQRGGGPGGGSEAGSPDGSIFVSVTPDASAEGGCDLTSDPKGNACVVSEAYGVFVSSGATAPGTGTMADPFSSIPFALAHLGNKSRVFVCNGDYSGPVSVTSSVQIYGGFSCTGGAWQWTGGVARVTSTGTDLPLTVQASAGSSTIEDMAFVAPAAVGQKADGSGVSSVAAVVLGGTVRLVRDVLIANNGASGADGVTGLREIDGGVQPTNYVPLSTDASVSRAPDGDAGVAVGSIVCNYTGDAGTSDRSSGGAGGDVTVDDSGVGGNGTSVPPAVFVPGTTPANQDGLGGRTSSVAGHRGEDGVARPGGTSSSPGTIVGGFWVPAAGTDGLPGVPGQGGGGGAATSVATLSFIGGAGAAGGCGGAGAFGGGGGGGSVALLVVGGSVTLVGCTLTAGNGGDGGNGGAGQDGQLGGRSRPPSTAASGGTGGNGAGGSGGAGGAGGVSAGIVYAKGHAPTYTAGDTVIATGNAGHPGTGGAAGQGPGAPGNPGAMGYAATAAAAIEVEATP
jgi:hypothetical protein